MSDFTHVQRSPAVISESFGIVLDVGRAMKVGWGLEEKKREARIRLGDANTVKMSSELRMDWDRDG